VLLDKLRASMLQQRDLKVDLLALGLLALTIFLAAALLSYDPADPPSKLVFPERLETLNVCGRSGAVASRFLLTAFGLGAYYLIVSLAALDAVLLARHAIGQPLLRLGGWLLSLVGVTALVAMALPQLSPGPVIGSGGYLGATARGFLQMHFATIGAYILTLSLVLGGLLLCTDYVLVHLLAWLIGRPAQGFGHGVLRMGAAYAQKLNTPKRRSDLDSYDTDGEADDEEDEPAVRVVGRPSDLEENAADEEAGSDEADEEDGEQTADAEAKTAGSALRITRPGRTQREEFIEELEAADAEQEPEDYELPAVDLLLPSEPFSFETQEKDVRRKAKILEKTFADFGFHIRVVEIQTGPVIAQFEVELEAGLRLSRITGLSDDLAIALRVPSVRIVAPIPGKNTVGIEVPNNERQIVRLREVIEETNGKAQKMRIPLYLGKDVSGTPMVVDLSTLPHLLIAGRTGTGKSVCLNSIITSIMMTRRPDEVRMLLIDPKMVELSPYKCLPHLMHPVVTDMRKAEAILGWAVEKMEERYHLLARAGVRHISVYNQLGEEELMERLQPVDEEERRQIPTHMPYLVIVADELADLMMTAAKEVESHIIRLAQKSRAVGIHLVLATQKPTVDVITGLIKSNLPARICFQVASRTDSRVVLDEMGADKLLGNGDMLFLWPGTSTMLRGQGTYLSDDEINKLLAVVGTNEPQFIKELVQLKTNEPQAGEGNLNSRDDLYEAAIDVVVREGRGSVSLLQRALGVGYGRAARLIDFMAEDGFVGPYNGSQAREVLISVEDWEQRTGKASTAATTPAKPRRSNKILLNPSRQDEVRMPGRGSPLMIPRAVSIDEPEEEEDEEPVAEETEAKNNSRAFSRKTQDATALAEEDWEEDDPADDAPFADEEEDEEDNEENDAGDEEEEEEENEEDEYGEEDEDEEEEPDDDDEDAFERDQYEEGAAGEKSDARGVDHENTPAADGTKAAGKAKMNGGWRMESA
jgi:DNA segregation ATPase FtsK/SpoIIIE, S-DNA-T family